MLWNQVEILKELPIQIKIFTALLLILGFLKTSVKCDEDQGTFSIFRRIYFIKHSIYRGLFTFRRNFFFGLHRFNHCFSDAIKNNYSLPKQQG